MITLLELRKAQKKTQQDVANYLSVSRQCYNRYETGARECDYNTLIRLADYFGVSVDYLLDHTPKTDETNPNTINIIKKMSERGITRERLAKLDSNQTEALLNIIEIFLNNLK